MVSQDIIFAAIKARALGLATKERLRHPPPLFITVRMMPDM